MNLLVTREFVTKTPAGVFEVSFIEEIVRAKTIIRSQDCAGLTFMNLDDEEVYINNIQLKARETRSFRSVIPFCILKSDFRVNNAIVGSTASVSGGYTPPSSI